MRQNIYIYTYETYRLLLSDIYTWLGKQMGLKCNIKLI